MYNARRFYSAITPAVAAFGHATPEKIEKLGSFLNAHHRMVVITGAGLSTESGIPDYRSPGRPAHKPIEHQQFLTNVEKRVRYWSRSMVGYPIVCAVKPNLAHHSLVDLERAGRVRAHITQNVDGLLLSAGSRHLLELHGSLHAVRCMDCGYEVGRDEVQHRLVSMNKAWWDDVQGRSDLSRPDGDFDLGEIDNESFRIPTCTICDGMLKPSVVFFGDTVPRHVVTSGMWAIEQADAVLVAGSSLAVYSAYRFVRAAHERNIPVAIVNAGPCRADPVASLKIEALLGDTLSRAMQLVSLA